MPVPLDKPTKDVVPDDFRHPDELSGNAQQANTNFQQECPTWRALLLPFAAFVVGRVISLIVLGLAAVAVIATAVIYPAHLTVPTAVVVLAATKAVMMCMWRITITYGYYGSLVYALDRAKGSHEPWKMCRWLGMVFTILNRWTWLIWPYLSALPEDGRSMRRVILTVHEAGRLMQQKSAGASWVGEKKYEEYLLFLEELIGRPSDRTSGRQAQARPLVVRMLGQFILFERLSWHALWAMAVIAFLWGGAHYN